MKTPKAFDLKAHNATWYSWADIDECFWPGAGRRSSKVNEVLAEVVKAKGVYCIAWKPKGEVAPTNKSVRYIGQTNLFKRRMEQFGWSAGFWDGRDSGHSAGWRWPAGRKKDMAVAFFPLQGDGLGAHMIEGFLHWYEALAMEAHFQKNNCELPRLNAQKKGVISLD